MSESPADADFALGVLLPPDQLDTLTRRVTDLCRDLLGGLIDEYEAA